MHVRQLWLTDFRNYTSLQLSLPVGTSVFYGDNGQGKTGLLEAVGYLTSMESFRAPTASAMVRLGADQAVLRAETQHQDRDLLLEAVIRDSRRSAFQVNRQQTRRQELLAWTPMSVFTPDDLRIVKEGPDRRRRFLDATAIRLDPRLHAVRAEVERVVRQRNALLRQAGGRLEPEVSATLDVWDEKLATAGEQLADARRCLVDGLSPNVCDTYAELAGRSEPVVLRYESAWPQGGLAEALQEARQEDVRRKVTTMGPHHDELAVELNTMPARTHASQGEQRSLALALLLSAHRELAAAHGPPLLLLDDVFSELDQDRAQRVFKRLEAAQTLITTASEVPPGVDPAAVFTIRDGTVAPTG